MGAILPLFVYVYVYGLLCTTVNMREEKHSPRGRSIGTKENENLRKIDLCSMFRRSRNEQPADELSDEQSDDSWLHNPYALLVADHT